MRDLERENRLRAQLEALSYRLWYRPDDAPGDPTRAYRVNQGGNRNVTPMLTLDEVEAWLSHAGPADPEALLE